MKDGILTEQGQSFSFSVPVGDDVRSYTLYPSFPIDDLKPFDGNPRNNEDAVDPVANSIKQFGFNNLIVTGPDFRICAGHTRIQSARELNMTTVPILVAEHLVGDDFTAYNIADNKTADIAEFDDDALGKLLTQLSIADDDEALSRITATGFDGNELDELIDSIESDLNEDEIPDLPKVAKTKPGDLYILGDHRLLCGDSTKPDDVNRLMAGEKADMVFTDPPYGVNYEGGHFHSGDVNIVRKREKIVADADASIYSAFLPVVLPHVSGPCYMWFADIKGCEVYNAVTDNGCQIHALIIWHKTNAKYAALNAQYKQRHEPCLYFKPKGSTLRWCGATTEATLWEMKRDPRNDLHPTQKPVELSQRAIGNHNANIVLDVFGGSGSTMIACENLERQCRMMEIDPLYCDVIVERWENLTGKEAVLNG